MPRWDVHFDMVIKMDKSSVIDKVSRAQALAGVIRGIPLPPYVQERLDRLNIVRAVRGTTGIEGTEVSIDEVAEILNASPGEDVLEQSRNREEQEVRNAAELMHYVAKQGNQNPKAELTEGLIKNFHELVTNNIAYPYNTPGQYRTFPVAAGDYLPPRSGDEVRKLMNEFVEWFNKGTPQLWNPIIRAIAAHFFLISIHPFGDGNGRTSRALESYLLYQARVNARGFYSLSNYYYRKRPEYVASLDNVRFNTDPDLTPFVEFALTGLVEELEAVHREVLDEVMLISFRDYARESLGEKLGSPTGDRMLSFLFDLSDKPVSLKALRTGRHQLSRRYRGVTTKTLSRDLNYLRERKLVVIEGDILKANLAVMTGFTVG